MNTGFVLYVGCSCGDHILCTYHSFRSLGNSDSHVIPLFLFVAKPESCEFSESPAYSGHVPLCRLNVGTTPIHMNKLSS
jgi:hypothetical protein